MHSLAVDARAFDRPFPSFAQPRVVSEYTIDRSRRLHLGRAAAPFLREQVLREKQKGLGWRLSDGYDTWEKKEPGDEKLDMLFEWMRQWAGGAEEERDLKKTVYEADFVCWRGLLTRIAATPYSNRDAWRFVAQRRGGVVFACEEKTEEAVRREASMSERDRLMTYWGFKFEQYMTSEKRGSPPSLDRPVCCREEFACVVRGRLAAPDGRPIRLLYSGEVDAVDEEGDLVEMKTQRHALEGGFWRVKSLKWWLQSFLVGIQQIVVGYRDDDGIVDSTGAVSVNELTRRGEWRGNVCLNVLSEVLSRVLSTVREEGSVCVVEYHPSTKKISIDPAGPSRATFISPEISVLFSLPDVV